MKEKTIEVFLSLDGEFYCQDIEVALEVIESNAESYQEHLDTLVAIKCVRIGVHNYEAMVDGVLSGWHDRWRIYDIDQHEGTYMEMRRHLKAALSLAVLAFDAEPVTRPLTVAEQGAVDKCTAEVRAMATRTVSEIKAAVDRIRAAAAGRSNQAADGVKAMGVELTPEEIHTAKGIIETMRGSL